MSDLQTEKSLSKTLIPEETSKRITALRFLLIVFVVFIHNNYEAAKIAESIANDDLKADFVFVPNAFSEWLQFFISKGIASCAVPLFFMFSAYLQFKKQNKYTALLKKRTKTLVVPYFLWIILNILILSILKITVSKLNSSLLQNPDNIPLFSWSPLKWISAFIGDYFNVGLNPYMHPYVTQFWFVRDLFIMILLSPLLTKLAKKFPIESLIFCFSFFICGTRPVIVHSQALLFYMLGFYWAEYDFDLFSFADKCKWKALVPLFVFLVVLDKLHDSSATNALKVFSSMLILLKFSSNIIKNEKWYSVTKYFAGFSFFLFAMHQPFVMGSLNTIWLKLFPMKNAFFCLFEYFGVTILNIVFCTCFGIALKKICPKLFAILNGGRG